MSKSLFFKTIDILTLGTVLIYLSDTAELEVCVSAYNDNGERYFECSNFANIESVTAYIDDFSEESAKAFLVRYGF